MEKIGRASFTGNSRHIHIHHFIVKGKVDKGIIEVKYCPTHLMISDYCIKPLQEEMSNVFFDFIMGYVHINDIF